MKQSTFSALSFVALAGVVLSVSSFNTRTVASAAPIVWGSPQTVSGDTDVSTAGTAVYAYNLGAAGVSSTTVNGVTFLPFVFPAANVFINTATTGSVTFRESPGALTSFSNLGTGTGSYAGLSAAYKLLLDYGGSASVLPTITGTLGGLTNGQQYQIQWWASNAAQTPGAFGTTMDATVADAATSPVTLDTNTTNTVGGLGQYVLGTFTANGTTQVFTLDGDPTGGDFNKSPLINAFQVRAVPEPSTCCMALAGLACGGFSMWRRRKRIRHVGAMLLIVAAACVAVGGSAVQAATVTWFGPSQAANSNATWTSGSTSAQNYGVAFVSGTASGYSMDWLQIGLNTSSVTTGSGSLVVDLVNTTNLTPYSAVPGTTLYASDTISFTCPPTTATAFTVSLTPAGFPNISNFSMTGTTGYALRLWGPSGAFGIMRTTGYANGTTNNFYSVSDGFVALDTFRNSTANYTNNTNSYPTLSIAFGTTAVPEPSTYAMAFAGVACGGYSMWRLRKRA
ncbi:MAG: PEP-CTERM sorting domain-containing protein [Pirellulales bacterium]